MNPSSRVSADATPDSRGASATPPPIPVGTGVAPGATSQAGRGFLGCLGFLVACLFIAWIANIGGCNSPTTNTASAPTKAEWLQKLESHYGQYARMRIVYQWKADDFKRFMGNPSSTQTVGDEVFWYYECADGQFQLVMDQGNLAIGIMAGKINDY